MEILFTLTKKGCDVLLLVALCVVILDGEISCNMNSSIALHHVTLFWIFNGKSGFSEKRYFSLVHIVFLLVYVSV